MIKALKIVTWIFIILGGIFLWLSLRSTEDNMEYTLYALGMVVVAWFTNYMVKRQADNN